MTLAEAFKSFWDHGAVERVECEKQAARAFRVLEPKLTIEEVRDVMTARGHAIGIGRQSASNRPHPREEFDDVMKAIGARLGLSR